MANKVGGYHKSWDIFGGDRVHNENHKNVGWVDKGGNVHKTGDTGGWFGKAATIGHVDKNGKVTMRKK